MISMKSYQVVDELDDAVCFVWTVVPELREALLSGLDALVCVRVGTRHVVSSEQLQNVLFVTPSAFAMHLFLMKVCTSFGLRVGRSAGMKLAVVGGGLFDLRSSGFVPGCTPARINTSWRDPLTTGGVIPSSSDMTNGFDETLLVEVAGTDSLSAVSSSSSFAFSSPAGSSLGLLSSGFDIVMKKRKMKINSGLFKIT